MDSASRSAINSCQKKTKYPEIQALKDRISFSKVLAADGHHIKKSGRGYSCCCPFHDDRNPSFVVSTNDSYAKCYGCDWQGDVIKYEQEYRDVDFATAVAGLSGKATRVAKTVQAPSVSLPVGLTAEQKHTIASAGSWLQEETHLWSSIAEKRDWLPETIQKLAFDGSLGWHGGALAFLYRTGLKYRNWPHHEFEWEFKSGESFWREHTITGQTTQVFVAEGETDAISMIDAGIADIPSVAVVAVSCASAIPDALELLRGKEVNGKLVSAGNVTIPADQPIPQVGDVAEVRYLYAMGASGALFQPVFLGARDDIASAECIRDQLKFRKEPEEVAA